MKNIDFYFDVISPYTYLAHKKIKNINSKLKINFTYKPILLGGLHKLADMLIKEKKLDYIYLLCGPDKSHIAENIIKLSGKDYFINCSNKDLSGVILAINNSEFLVGNNSGPLNLAAALGVKSFGLIANDPISELKYSKIIPITPDDYQDNIWIRDREAMKRLDVQKVFETIIKNV